MVCTEKLTMLSAFLLLNIAAQSLNDGDRFDSYLAHIYSAWPALDTGEPSRFEVAAYWPLRETSIRAGSSLGP